MFEELEQLKIEANNPNFNDNSKCHNWRKYVPDKWKDNWLRFTERERQIIVFMASENADKEDWD